MLSLDDLCTDLAASYNGGWPLLQRLADPKVRTAQPRDGDPFHSTPGSRPPADLSPVSWLLRIRSEAAAMDMGIRGSTRPRPPILAIRQLPTLTPPNLLGDVSSQVGTWHSTCLTVLGYQRPTRDVRGVACLACGQKMLKWRPTEELAVSSTDASALGRVRCNNPDCAHTVTGRPAIYEGLSLYTLIRGKV